MKYLSILVILISSSIAFGASADSSGNCTECQATLAGMPSNNAIREISALGTRVINEKNRKFADELCVRILSARNATGEDIPTLIRNEFAKFLNIKTSDADYQSKVTSFWNKNQNDFICSGKINTQYRESEHFLKRMINLNEDSNFFYRFLLKDKKVDVNAIEYVNGEPETIIDFLDKIIEDPNSDRFYSRKEMIKLRKSLTKYFGAKKALDV